MTCLQSRKSRDPSRAANFARVRIFCLLFFPGPNLEARNFFCGGAADRQKPRQPLLPYAAVTNPAKVLFLKLSIDLSTVGSGIPAPENLVVKPKLE